MISKSCGADTIKTRVAGSGNILLWHLIMNEVFSVAILSLLLIQEGQWSVSGERILLFSHPGSDLFVSAV